MANKELNVKVKHRYDTASNWTTNNPVLLAGEIGIESDTGKIKIGNGVSTWNTNEYFPAIKDQEYEHLVPHSGGSNPDEQSPNLKPLTERAIATALPFINGNHAYTAHNDIYAPITCGTTGQILTANTEETIYGGWEYKTSGGTPTWKDPSELGLITGDGVDEKLENYVDTSTDQYIAGRKMFLDSTTGNLLTIGVSNESYGMPAVIVTSTTNSSYQQVFPKKSGVFAMTSDIPTEYLKSATVSDDTLTITKQDGTQVVFSNGGSGSELTGGVTTEMLWEATASEQTQSLGNVSRTLKANDCDVFEIGYRYNTTYNFVKSVFVPAVAGQRTLLDFVNTPVMLFVRAVTIDSKTQISFASSYYGNTAGESADNSTIIPIFVRGWKFN